MTGDKLRFRFAKTGTLRLLSHHDLMRCLERMLRRADLPFKSTEGFHPGPRVVFALSLPLGVEARDEVVEIEFLRILEADDVLAKLKSQAPTGLEFTRVAVVPMKATARPRRVTYSLDLPPERANAVAERCAELMAESKVWVDRLKPSSKRLNIRPYFRSLEVRPNPPAGSSPSPLGLGVGEGSCLRPNPATGFSPSPLRGGVGEGSCFRPNPPAPFPKREGGEADWFSLVLDLWVTQTGTARVDEILKLLDLSDLAEAGAIVERITVELRDEVSASDPNDQPPDGPADTLPLDPAAIAALSRREEEQPAAAGWGVMPAGSVVE